MNTKKPPKTNMKEKPSIILLERAKEKGETWVNSLTKTRKLQWEFLAAVYLYYQNVETKIEEEETGYIKTNSCTKLFCEVIHKKLNRYTTLPERKRPFLALLHYVLEDKGIKLDDHLQTKCSKMAGALEVVEKHFRFNVANDSQVVKYIEINGGVHGLYRRYRERLVNNIGKEKVESGKENVQRKINGDDATIKDYGIVKVKIKGYGDTTKIGFEGVKAGKHRYDVEVDKDGYITSMKKVEILNNTLSKVA